jgi:hypothetical protein
MFISIYFHHFRETLVAFNLQGSRNNSVESANCLNFEVSDFFFFFFFFFFFINKLVLSVSLNCL